MTRYHATLRRIALIITTMAVGTMYGACSAIGTQAGKLLTSVNPCGTLIDCDPAEFDILFNDIDYGQFADWEKCPVSVFPSECVGTFPPTVEGGGGNGGDDGGNDNNNNNNNNQNQVTPIGF